jgi:hypothetical protein
MTAIMLTFYVQCAASHMVRQADKTTVETTSHPTGKATSHSTRLSKNDNQVAGYKPPKNDVQVAGYQHGRNKSAFL